jgi:chorismate synthase
MSIPAIKAVGIGIGAEAAALRGSQAHDVILPPAIETAGRPTPLPAVRPTNRAGGLEGGFTTGEPLVLRVAMKPISTLMRPLGTVDVATGQAAQAVAERSDVTAVPAMGVIAEAMAAFVLAGALLEKFGGDSLRETQRNLDAYLARLDERVGG